MLLITHNRNTADLVEALIVILLDRARAIMRCQIDGSLLIGQDESVDVEMTLIVEALSADGKKVAAENKLPQREQRQHQKEMQRYTRDTAKSGRAAKTVV